MNDEAAKENEEGKKGKDEAWRRRCGSVGEEAGRRREVESRLRHLGSVLKKQNERIYKKKNMLVF